MRGWLLVRILELVLGSLFVGQRGAVEYSVGTLVVGLTDPAQSKIVFGGAVVGILECSDNLQGRIESGVDSIFSAYPYNAR